MNPDQDGDSGKIRITLEDLNQIQLPAAQESQSGTRTYGSVTEAPPPVPEGKTGGKFFMKAWVYLGLAGLIGSLSAWAICEPSFIDGDGNSWANLVIFPLMLVLICAGFAIAESVVERSPRKAAIRGLLSLGVGAILGFIFHFIASLIFTIGLSILSGSGVLSVRHPGFWITRGIAWMGFGVAGGVVYGIVGQSGKKCLFGIAGGVLGAGLGGLIFDPIAMAVGGAGTSRAIGMALFGLATGVSIGLVESALKDRWIYVSAGPLAGKQFILYKTLTTIGSDQSCDIYLFKDPGVRSQHAVVELRGTRALMRAAGPVYIQGRAVREAMLESGNSIQIGRYAFLYRDRERA
jgi:hypothetical protein